MALLTSADGFISAATTIQTFEGKLQLQFSSANGTIVEAILDSNKITQAGPFTLDGGSNRFEGFRVLGSGHAISDDTAATGTHRVYSSYGSESLAAGLAINAAVGKVSAVSPGLSENETNIKDASSFVGFAYNEGALVPEQGAILITSTAIAASNGVEPQITVGLNDSTFSTGNATIHGGTGTAMITEMGGAFTFTSPAEDLSGNGFGVELQRSFDVGRPIASITSITASPDDTYAIRDIDFNGNTVSFTAEITAAGGGAAGTTFAINYVTPADSAPQKVRLDEVSYPFTIATADALSISPVGSSLLLIP